MGGGAGDRGGGEMSVWVLIKGMKRGRERKDDHASFVIRISFSN